MKAVQIKKYGTVEVLEINHHIPKPVAGEDQVLVETYAASINPFDWKLRSGIFKDKIPLKLPVVLGGDFSGIVTNIGKNNTFYKPGDKVYGHATVLNGSSGAFAQFIAVNIKNLAIMPDNLGFPDAASLPLVGTCAIQAIEEHIRLKTGHKILIHGGAGGIGSVAIQLAKHKGAYVATTVGMNDGEFVKNLGADKVIIYQNQVFEEILKDYDAVYDTVGGDITSKSLTVLKKGGILVSTAGQPDQNLANKFGVTAIGQNTKTTTESLKLLSMRVNEGVIVPVVNIIFPLEQIREAFTYKETNHARGKVVINMKV